MTDFIAEICSNHNGDLDRALKLIDTAADIGCSGVKFQLFRIDNLFAPEALAHPDYQFLHKRREWELPIDWLPVLAKRCKDRGIKFGCTPFYLEAVEQLAPFVDFYKIASYNVLDYYLIRAIAKQGKPTMISAGMATMEEIADVLSFFVLGSREIVDLTILHCISQYPTPLENCNPRVLFRLANKVELRPKDYTRQTRLKYNMGWSDHTADPAAIFHFVGLVDVFEFHLDLEGDGNEYKMGHCWLPEEMRRTIEIVRGMEAIRTADMPDVEYTESESHERLWRADPGDGLRPVREIREMLGK